MASTINATVSGVVIASDATGALNIQVGGVNAIEIGASASVVIGDLALTSLTLTNPLTVAQGGTGLTSTPTNGQLLIGNGTGFTLATLTAGSGMTITNNAGSITLAAGGLPAVIVTSSTAISAVAGNHYILTATSTATVTLPASPTISDTIYVTNAGSLTTNVIARNGKPIQGIAEDMTLNSLYASAQLRFTNDTVGWVMA